MASFLDVTLLGGLKSIFLWLLVYVIVWGLLTMIKPFGEKAPNGPYALIALVAATLSITSTTLRVLIEFLTPWFVFLIILIFFVIFLIRIFGIGENDIIGVIKDPTVYTIILVIVTIIVLFGLGEAFGQRSLESTQGEPQAQYSEYPVINDGSVPGYGPANQDSGRPQPGQPGATNTGDFSLNFINTLFHPKMLGIIAMILIAFVTVWLLSRPQFGK